MAVITDARYFFTDKMLTLDNEQDVRVVSNENRYHNLTRDIKITLSKQMVENGMETLGAIQNNLDEISKRIQMNLCVDTYDEAVKLLMKVDILAAFNINRRQHENFDCIILNGNVGSVSERDSKFRYFSTDKNTSEKWFFSLIDLYEIIFNIPFYKAVAMLCKKTGIDVKEEKWVFEQKIRFADNLQVIGEAEDEMKVRYPHLYKYIHKHLYLFKEMNNLAITNTRKQELSVNNETVFFASARYLEGLLENTGIRKGHTIIGNTLNAFAALGLIKKVPLANVPSVLSKNIKTKVEVNGKLPAQFVVTFWSVPEFDTNVLQEAERRARKLIEAKVSATKITMDNLAAILGKEVFDAVYGDSIKLTIAIKKQKSVLSLIRANLPF